MINYFLFNWEADKVKISNKEQHVEMCKVFY